jgi:hypothetical protein
VEPWINYFIFLSLTFLIFQLKITIAYIPWHAWGIGSRATTTTLPQIPKYADV